MTETYHYFSLQYSAIQKTVLRHDRLWSIAGISQILSVMNELELPNITEKHNGEVLVAGGGKFTARFKTEKDAKDVALQIIKTVSATLPMLEFQYSDIISATSLKDAKEKGLIQGLSDQKFHFRGYAVSFNPHMKRCAECEEYPALSDCRIPSGKGPVCAVCFAAREAKIDLRFLHKSDMQKKSLTSIQRIYGAYIGKVWKTESDTPKVPADFKDLFPGKKKDGARDDERRRMAVWFSDTNNMNLKVPVWLSQEDQDIRGIFDVVKNIVIDYVSKALAEVFPESTWNRHDKIRHIPFRLIVAGGDDLCMVMPEEYVLPFARSLSTKLSEKLAGLGIESPLHPVWLEKHCDQKQKKQAGFGKYCFGASFVVTSTHTPFKKIHELGESLMGEAKTRTDREADSVNWQILSADEHTEEVDQPKFEKPVFINDAEDGENRTRIPEALSLSAYMKLAKFYEEPLSNTKRQQAADLLINYANDPLKIERELIRTATAGLDKGVKFLLVDPSFRKGRDAENGPLDCRKIASLLALMNIKTIEGKEEKAHD